MSKYKTKISRDDYLKALALFTMAHDHYAKAGTFGDALNRIIMAAPEKYPGGHVDDAIYSDERGTVEAFDEALRREGIEVEAESSATSNAA
jgi:hypothetical protein